MIRGVIDTSVLVSAVISPTGPNAQLFDFIIAKKIRPCLTAAVLEEYVLVFEYELLNHMGKRRIALLRGVLERTSIKVGPISTHEDDNRIHECAGAAKADYIVTETSSIFESRTSTRKSSLPAFGGITCPVMRTAARIGLGCWIYAHRGKIEL